MKNTIEYIKKIGSFTLAVLIILLLIVPYFLIVIYLKKNMWKYCLK